MKSTTTDSESLPGMSASNPIEIPERGGAVALRRRLWKLNGVTVKDRLDVTSLSA
jgi:hypothetical protein